MSNFLFYSKKSEIIFIFLYFLLGSSSRKNLVAIHLKYHKHVLYGIPYEFTYSEELVQRIIHVKLIGVVKSKHTTGTKKKYVYIFS